MLSIPATINETPDAPSPRERRCDGCVPGSIQVSDHTLEERGTQFELTCERIRLDRKQGDAKLLHPGWTDRTRYFPTIEPRSAVDQDAQAKHDDINADVALNRMSVVPRRKPHNSVPGCGWPIRAGESAGWCNAAISVTIQTHFPRAVFSRYSNRPA